MTSQVAPPPAGLSDDEFNRFSTLSTKKTLTDAEMGDFSSLDSRLHVPKAAAPAQPAAEPTPTDAEYASIVDEKSLADFGKKYPKKHAELTGALSAGMGPSIHGNGSADLADTPQYKPRQLTDPTEGITQPFKDYYESIRQNPEMPLGDRIGKGASTILSSVAGAAAAPFALAAAPFKGTDVGNAIEYPFKKLREGQNYEPHYAPGATDEEKRVQKSLFPGRRMIPGTQDVANTVGAPEIAPALDLVALGALHEGFGALREPPRMGAADSAALARRAPQPAVGSASPEPTPGPPSPLERPVGPAYPGNMSEHARTTSPIQPQPIAPPLPLAEMAKSSAGDATWQAPKLEPKIVPNVVRTGLDQRVVKAGFKSLDDAVRQARTGEMNSGLVMLKPADLAEVQRLAGQPLRRGMVPEAGDSSWSPNRGTPPEDLPPYRASLQPIGSTDAGATGTVAREAQPTGASMIRDALQEGLRRQSDAAAPKGGAPMSPPVEPPPAGGELPQPGPPLGKQRGGLTPAWLDTSIEHLKQGDEYGPAGASLSNDLHDVMAGKRTIVGEVGTPLEKSFEALDRQQRGEAQADLDRWKSGEIPTPEWARPLVDASRVAMREIANHENSAGVRIQENGITAEDMAGRRTPEWAVRNGEKPGTFDITRPVPNDNPSYVPGGGTPEYKAAILAENRPGWKGPTPLTDEWMATGENAAKENPFKPREGESAPEFHKRTQSQMESFFAGDERAHNYDWPRSAQIPNKVDLFRNRIARGAQNAAEQRVFEYRRPDAGGGFTVGKDEGRLAQHFSDIRDLAMRDDPRITQQEASAAAESAKTLALRNLGRNPADTYGPGGGSKFVKGWNKWEAVYTTLSKLGLSIPHIFTRSGHALDLAARVGPKLASKSLYDAATGYASMRESGMRAGSIEPGMNEIVRSGVVDEPRTGGRVYNALQSTTRVMTAPANAVTKFISVAAHGASEGHLANIQEALGEGGRKAAWAERAMQTLDLSPGDMQAIRDGNVSPLLRDKFAQSLVDKVSLKAGTGEKPAVMTNPKWASFWRFKGVHAAATREFLDVSVREAAHGNVAPLATVVAGSVGLAMAKNQLLQSLGLVSSADDKGLLAKFAQGDVAGMLKYVAKATATQGATGNIAPLADASWAGQDNKSRLYEEATRTAIPPWMNSVGNLVKQIVLSGDRKTVKDYAAQGREAPDVPGREAAPSTRMGARMRAGRDLAAEELPQMSRIVKATAKGLKALK